MPAIAKRKKDPAAVALGRKGGKKGGLARAASMTPAQRSESARKAVQARWAKSKAKRSADYLVNKGDAADMKTFNEFRIDEAAPVIDTSKKALSACLKRIKETKDENELLRLSEQLQRIVFRRQYQNAKA
jgi:hypothetical protein